MPWQSYEVKASDEKFAGSLSDYIAGLGERVYDRELNNVSIPLSNGVLEVKRPHLKTTRMHLTFTPTQEQLFGLYSQIPSVSKDLALKDYFQQEFYVKRSLGNGTEGEKVDFRLKVSPNLKRADRWRYEEREKDSFTAEVVFPESLTSGKSVEYDGYRTRLGIDDEKHETASAIAKQMRREGHKIAIREFECVKQTCISPREINSTGFVEAMKRGNGIEYFVSSWDSNYSMEERLKNGLTQTLNLEASPELIDISLTGRMHYDLSDSLQDFVKGMNLTVQPDSVVHLDKKAETTPYRIAKGILRGIGMALEFAIVEPPTYVARKLVIEPRRERKELERQAVLETLKEGQIYRGTYDSCLIQMDPVCMIKRTEKIKAEKQTTPVQTS